MADLLDYIGAVQVVADIGAGTGQLTRLFAQRCTRVYAVEPDPAIGLRRNRLDYTAN